jgi:hypothetical protein
MSYEHSSESIERVKEGSKFWEGGIGRSRFRALWDRGPGYAQFHFQGPFTQNDDPDGMGVPFSTDFGIAWKREQGARLYGEHWNNLRDRWKTGGRETLIIAEKALAELEKSIANMRQKQSTNQSESKTIQNEQALKAQRVPIEYDKTYDPFDDGSTIDSVDIASHKPLLNDKRDARRRVILEAFRAGTISLEEAELRLNNLN